MRKIKFRAWDNENSCFYKPTYEAYKGNLEEILMSPSGDLNMRTFKKGTHIEILNHESNFPDRFILMQYTGLKDKNGKEIYEGDIITTLIKPNRGKDYIETIVVKWDIYEDDEYCNHRSGFDIPDNSELFEIIGNIYKNPELIEHE